jgi:hypothetical protein
VTNIAHDSTEARSAGICRVRPGAATNRCSRYARQQRSAIAIAIAMTIASDEAFPGSTIQ